MIPKARQERMLVQEVGEEVVIYDRRNDRAHRLSPAAVFVWRRCDGRTTEQQLAAAVEQELGVANGPDVVALALEDLGRAELLENGRSVEVSRRRLMKKLAAAGIAAAVLPVVTSIATPTPAVAQQSGDICDLPRDPEEPPPPGCGGTPT